MTTTPVANAAAAGSPGAGGSSNVSNPSGTLGENDFLKLMIAQLQAQNPLEPANTGEFMGELAQFTQVEQLTNLASANELSSAVGLIGRTVDYTSNGEGGTGVVTSAQSTASGTTVTVGEVSGIPLTGITEVK